MNLRDKLRAVGGTGAGRPGEAKFTFIQQEA